MSIETLDVDDLLTNYANTSARVRRLTARHWVGNPAGATSPPGYQSKSDSSDLPTGYGFEVACAV